MMDGRQLLQGGDPRMGKRVSVSYTKAIEERRASPMGRKASMEASSGKFASDLLSESSPIVQHTDFYHDPAASRKARRQESPQTERPNPWHQTQASGDDRFQQPTGSPSPMRAATSLGFTPGNDVATPFQRTATTSGTSRVRFSDTSYNVVKPNEKVETLTRELHSFLNTQPRQLDLVERAQVEKKMSRRKSLYETSDGKWTRIENASPSAVDKFGQTSETVIQRHVGTRTPEVNLLNFLGTDNMVRGPKGAISFPVDRRSSTMGASKQPPAFTQNAQRNEDSGTKVGGLHEMLANVPGSVIRPEHHMIETSFRPPEDSTLRSVFNERDQKWHTTVFPRIDPGTDCNIELLDEWMTHMLRNRIDYSRDAIGVVKDVQYIYSMCFHEISRQVFVHSVDRGKLMTKIWTAYLELFDHMLDLHNEQRDYFQKQLNRLMDNREETKQKIRNQERLQSHMREIRAEMTKMRDTLTHYGGSDEKFKNEEKEFGEAVDEREREHRSIQHRSSKSVAQWNKIQTQMAESGLLDLRNEYNEDESDEIRQKRLLNLRRKHDRYVDQLADQFAKLRAESESTAVKIGGYLASVKEAIIGKTSMTVGTQTNISGKAASRTPKPASAAPLKAVAEKGGKRKAAAAGKGIGKLGRRVSTKALALQGLMEGSQKRDDLASDRSMASDGGSVQSTGSFMSTSDATETTQTVSDLVGPLYETIFGSPATYMKDAAKNTAAMSLEDASNMATAIVNAKFVTDHEDDKRKLPRLPLHSYLFHYFLKEYGTPQKAKQAMFDFLRSIKLYRRTENDILVQIFADCAGVGAIVGTPQASTEAFGVYVYALKICQEIASKFEEQLSQDTVLSEKVLILLVKHIKFEPPNGFIDAVGTSEIKEYLALYISDEDGEQQRSDLRLEQFLEMVWKTWGESRSRRFELFESVLNAGDRSGDGHLEFEQVKTILRSVDPKMSSRQIVRIFSESLDPMGVVIPSKFSNICLEKQIAIHSEVVHTFLESEWNNCTREKCHTFIQGLPDDDDRLGSLTKDFREHDSVISEWKTTDNVNTLVRQQRKLTSQCR